MSFGDFIQKKRREITSEGLPYAVRTGLQEALVKTMQPYASWRATPIWAADADVVLILDACRADLWDEVAARKFKQTDYRWSVGSASVEWVNETFADQYAEYWQRAGYVTANPHSAKEPDAETQFRDSSVYPLAERGLAYLDEVWRDQWQTTDLETVTPEIVTERALWAWQRRATYDMDTLVVHYMQPHVPLKKRPEFTDGWQNTMAFGEPDKNPGTKDDWHKLRDGEIPFDEFWNAYAANLEWVLRAIEPWFTSTDATILVTSDHGNAAGEWGQWGHPPGTANPALRKVPWVIVEGTNESDYTPTPPGSPPVVDGLESVDERLEALGYR